jgi:hypothetical protein
MLTVHLTVHYCTSVQHHTIYKSSMINDEFQRKIVWFYTIYLVHKTMLQKYLISTELDRIHCLVAAPYLLVVCTATVAAELKGPSNQTTSAWKLYGLTGLDGDMRRGTFTNFNTLALIFKVPWNSYVTDTKNLPIFLSWQALNTCRLRIPLPRFPKLSDQSESVFHLFLVSYWLKA